MVNEILFVVAVLVDLTFILFSLRFGKAGLVAALTVNLILVSTFAPKLIATFGFVMVGFAMKAIIGFISIPFMYFGRSLVPLESENVA